MSRKAISHLFILIPMLLLFSCGASKEPLTEANWRQMENTVTHRSFMFSANSVDTRSGRLNRMDNLGYMKMDGDQVEMELPYFGSSQVSTTYGRTEGMRFEGAATDIATKKNETGGYYDLNFNLKNKSEVLECNLRVFSGMRAALTINSSKRSTIRYDGSITQGNFD